MQNQTEGATGLFTQLAHILHVGIPWCTVHKYSIIEVQAPFLCVSGGTPLEGPFLLFSRHEISYNLDALFSDRLQRNLNKTSQHES